MDWYRFDSEIDDRLGFYMDARDKCETDGNVESHILYKGIVRGILEVLDIMRKTKITEDDFKKGERNE